MEPPSIPPSGAPPPAATHPDRTRLIIAALMVLVGIVWIAQGLGAPIGGGLMVGDPFWAWAGAALAVAGLAVAAWPRLRRR